ncbi:MAG: hypothetical protein AAF320_06700 [Myxococcota bacterium]
MNKVKLLVAGSSLVFAMLATGCGDKKCSEYKTESDCKGKKEGETQCTWDTTSGTGVCKLSTSVTSPGDAGNQDGVQQSNATQPTNASQNSTSQQQQQAQKELGKICMAKAKVDYNGVCNPDKAIDFSKATTDDARKKLCTDVAPFCEYEAAATCKLNEKAAQILAVQAVADLNNDIVVQAAALFAHGEYVQIQDKAKTGWQVLGKTASLGLEANAVSDNACLSYDAKNCEAGLVAIRNTQGAGAGDAALVQDDNRQLTSISGFCMLDGTRLEEGCKVDWTELAKVVGSCEAANDADNPEEECEKMKAMCEYKLPSKKALVDATTDNNSGDNGSTGN